MSESMAQLQRAAHATDREVERTFLAFGPDSDENHAAVDAHEAALQAIRDEQDDPAELWCQFCKRPSDGHAH